MNIWGKNERSWRRKNKRAVSPIIATILLVAITVVLAAVLYILIQQYTKNGSNGSPLGTAFSFSGTTDAASANNNYYNATIESAGSSLNFGNLIFQLKTAGGAVFATGVMVAIVNPSGAVEGYYCLGTITAGGGGGDAPYACAAGTGWHFPNANACGAPSFTGACSTTAVFTTASYLSIAVTPVTVSLTGYTLYALGQGAYSGTVSGPIT